MDYPNGYNVPAFPAGKSLAVARWMGICILMVSVLIVVSCGMILWAAHSRTTNPIVLSVNNLTGQWDQIQQTNGPMRYSSNEMFQISAVNQFVHNWFLITPYINEDEARWQKCEISDCPANDTLKYKRLSGDETCAIFCSTNIKLFNVFAQDVVPVYRQIAENGEYWMVDNITITPTNTPLLWQVIATIKSQYKNNINYFDVFAYATIGHDSDRYIGTAGFYVSDFKAYRIQ